MNERLLLLPESEQIVVGVEQGKFLLSPGLVLQVSGCGQVQIFVQRQAVPILDVVGSDIDLPIVFLGVEAFKLKKVNLDVVFLYHQIALEVGTAKFRETQLVQVKVPGPDLVAHGEFGMDVCQHSRIDLFLCWRETPSRVAHSCVSDAASETL